MSDATDSKTNRILSIAGIVISLGSLVVALCSLSLTFYAGIAARNHNRISLTPRLYFFPERTNQDPEVGLLLMNSGLGPAFIKTWTVSVDNVQVGDFNGGWDQALQKLNLPYEKVIHQSSFKVLESGKNAFILSINQEEWGKLKPPDKQAFLNAMKRIKVVIDYDSVYGEHQQSTFATGEW